ncbi:MAG: metallophosphoesterase [Desulfobacteraceae bacterium]|nr:metallophosphoesterase [Desulfobacteraceae bacterium]
MRILVISDSHGNVPLALLACEMADTFDALFHLGDGGEDAEYLALALDSKVIHVAGNCDTGSDSPRELLLECEGKRLLLVHGDAYGVKGGLGTLVNRAREAGADAVLFGHTHRATVTTLSGILAVNPGTLLRTAPRKSFAILEITPSGISAQLYDID